MERATWKLHWNITYETYFDSNNTSRGVTNPAGRYEGASLDEMVWTGQLGQLTGCPWWSTSPRLQTPCQNNWQTVCHQRKSSCSTLKPALIKWESMFFARGHTPKAMVQSSLPSVEQVTSSFCHLTKSIVVCSVLPDASMRSRLVYLAFCQIPKTHVKVPRVTKWMKPPHC